MYQVCPYCNGISRPGPCPRCGVSLEDLGMVEDFFGPYSPYENDEIIEGDYLENTGNILTCTHLVYCPNCHYHHRIKVSVGTINYQ